MEPITLPAIMTLAQWQKAEQLAKQAVVNSLRPPQIGDFIDNQVSKYPRWLTMMVIGMMASIIFAGFIISAGKQIAGYDTIYSYLANHERLSPLWVSVVLVAGILFTEIGAITFTLAPAIFGDAHKRTFKVTAVACALLAILANVAVTSGHDFGTPMMTILAWVMTIFAPGIVLVGTLVGERVILEHLDRRQKAMVDFEIARRQHTAYVNQPATHPEYAGYLRRYWLETYRRMLRDDADQLSDPEVVNLLAMRDFTYYGATSPNFSLLANTASDKPALTAGE